MVKTKKPLSPLAKLLPLQDLTVKRSGRWLTKHLWFAIEHLPDKEELISKVFKTCVLILFMLKRSKTFQGKISSMLEYLPKSKWTTFLDNLSSLEDLNTLAIQLLQILLQELTSKEKACKPFWTPAFKTLSENLLLPIKTGSVGLDTTSSMLWLQEQEVKLPSLSIQKTNLVNKNLPTTCYPSSMSSHVGKWVSEVTPPVKVRTLKVKIYPTKTQKKILDEFIDTSRYVYNRTLEQIKSGHKPNFQSLRDLLVTEKTKKGHDKYKALQEGINEIRKEKKARTEDEALDEINGKIEEAKAALRKAMKEHSYVRNVNIQDFETFTPKDIRSNAVNRCCDAYKSGFTNLKRGNIKFFNLKFKKKTEKRQTIELTPKNISICGEDIKILPETFKEECFLHIDKRNKRRIKGLKISTNTDIVRTNGEYYLHLCIPTKPKEQVPLTRVAGIDMGLRAFATVHTSNVNNNDTCITEYKHRSDLLKKLNAKLDMLKVRERVRKKQFKKIEKRKRDLVNLLHWEFINHILVNNDVLFYGDIKSHDIVKGGRNKRNNRNFNDLKFYQLKQRLIYKASLYGKRVIVVPEHHTTKTCSCCGTIDNKVGSKDTYLCSNCGMEVGRDANASKNIKMKGFLL
jgi:IS605 OrfB family transposase